MAEHKVLKNQACSLGVFERYRDEDLVSPRIDPAAKIMSLPRPAGVVLALTPSTNPVCSVFFKVILCLLTRNAIVVSPHPMAKDCCGDAARMLAAAATEAGAPDGVISLVEDVDRAARRGADGRPGDQRDRGHRGHRGGPGRAPVRQPGPGRRPGQRPGAGRRDRGRGHRGPADHREQGLRQLGAVHQRVGADRRGRRGRPAAGPAQAVRRGAARRGRPGPAAGLPVPRRPAERRGDRQGRVLDRGPGRAAGAAADQGPARPVPAGAARGAVRAREAQPGARRGHHGDRRSAASRRPAR